MEAIFFLERSHEDPDPTRWARAMSKACLEECIGREQVLVFSGNDPITLARILHETSSETVLVVGNDQMIMNPAALREMAKVLLQNESVAAVGPVSLQSTHSIQCEGPASQFHNKRNYYTLAEEYSRDNQHAVKRCDFLESSCILYRRSFLEKLPPNTILDHTISELKMLDMPLMVARSAFVFVFSGMYDHIREDLIALVPDMAESILDVGASKGYMGKAIKNRKNCHITGIEIDPALASIASGVLDEVIVGSVEEEIPKGPFDCIICGDVLEHLMSPWDTLKNLRKVLSDDGALVASIPNVRHWSIIKDLLEGHWEYVPAGLLCSGHIRFFTRASILELFKRAGFALVEMFPQNEDPSPEGKKFVREVYDANLVSEIEDLRTLCFLIRAWK